MLGAQALLGGMYATERGVPGDLVEAHKWTNLAASRTSGEDAEKLREARELVAEAMTREQISEAQRLAREWKPKTWEELKAQSQGQTNEQRRRRYADQALERLRQDLKEMEKGFVPSPVTR